MPTKSGVAAPSPKGAQISSNRQLVPIAEADQAQIVKPDEVQLLTEPTPSCSKMACPDLCRVVNLGSSLTVNTPTDFSIEAYDDAGRRRDTGGDAFFVAIRGASRVRGRVTDNKDGTYSVSWKPLVSGSYNIAVSLWGNALKGSPYSMYVYDPSPYAPNSEVSGKALNHITARTSSSFEIRYRDRGGNIAQAVELDVFVVPIVADGDDASASAAAWHLASGPVDDGSEQIESGPAAMTFTPTGGGSRSDKSKDEHLAPRRQASQRVSFMPEALSRQHSVHDDDGDYASVASVDEADAGDSSLGLLDDEDNPADNRFESMSESTIVKKRAIRVQVGAAPLIVRADAELNSEWIGQLHPGQICTVVEERITSGNVRACVTYEVQSALSPQVASDIISPSFGPGGADAESSQVDGGVAAPLGTGWVTLKKNGRKLVSSRLRLEPTERDQHMQQWKRRQFNDKLNRSVKSEVEMDPIGFAFGGVHPGWLHAKGVMHKSHQVSYSIGKVGRYLLHVRLRQQAVALPGSPFALTVTPGYAHPANSQVMQDSVPQCGPVGLASDDGVTILLQTADQMGNLCTEGGARVTTTCTDKNVEAECEDLNNGQYHFRWRCKISGSYDMKVMIDNVPVVNSPCRIKLLSTVAELPKTIIEGDGIRSAIAGEIAALNIHLYDSYGNLASPGESFIFKVAITQERKKMQDLQEHDFTGWWSRDSDGEYNINYIAKVAGHHDLHIWCDPNQKGERLALPNSPFSLHVTPGTPSAKSSTVEDLIVEARASAEKGGGRGKQKAQPLGDDTAEGAGRAVAGDAVSVRPQIVDVFNNPTKLGDGMLTAKVIGPDDSETLLKVVQQVKAGVISYELRYETSQAGSHEMHVLLNDEGIQGSPVPFQVLAALPDPQSCKLILPDNAQKLEADFDKPSVVTLKTFDKFGNPCSHGGLYPQARLQYIKSDANDQTILMANNHSINVQDLADGTYAIKIAIKMKAMLKLTVDVDKNAPNGTGVLPAVQIGFS